MSRVFVLDPLKLLLRSSSEKMYRCSWCREHFEDHAQLSNHVQGTIPLRGSRDEQVCVSTFRCEWCHACYGTLLELSKHTRGTTRSCSFAGLESLSYTPEASSDQAKADNPPDAITMSSGQITGQRLDEQMSGLVGSQDAEGSANLSQPQRQAESEQHKEAIILPNQIAMPDGGITAGDDRRRVQGRGITGGYLTEAKSGSIDSTKMVLLRKEEKASDSIDLPRTYGYSHVLPTSLVSYSASPTYGVPGRLDTTASARTFVTARTSSSASYRTAPSFSRRVAPRSVTELISIHNPNGSSGSGPVSDRLEPGLASKTLARQVKHEVGNYHGFISPSAHATIESIVSRREHGLVTSKSISLASVASEANDVVEVICAVCLSAPKPPQESDEFRGVVAQLVLEFIVAIYDLAYVAENLNRCFYETYSYQTKEKRSQVFGTEWRDHLRSRGLMLHPLYELDWSGRGQHVEYDQQDEKDIPLTVEKVLGYSATAIVESVMCRRIRLARKKIRCTRQLTKVDYIAEVEHLHRLQHAHILRVVGTYTLKKDLAILLYPVAPWNLDDFMDELVDTQSPVNNDILQHGTWRHRVGAKALGTAFGCLAHALAFIHNKNVKHMDIKPKNLLISAHGTDPNKYKIYIADFGIARSYKSANEADTDSPISFTRAYAAPEVVLQDMRGFSADVFSLGCVFLEMVATLVSKPSINERQKLADIRASAFHASLRPIGAWFQEASVYEAAGFDEFLPKKLLSLIPRMIEQLPSRRPSAEELDHRLDDLCCTECDSGPEQFEAAESMP